MKKISKTEKIKHTARFAEIFFVVRGFCLRKGYNPELVGTISLLVFVQFYGKKNKLKMPRNTARLRHKKIGAIFESVIKCCHLKGADCFSVNDIDFVTDYFRNIHYYSLTDLSKIYTEQIEELLQSDVNIFTKDMRVLLSVFLRGEYSIDQVRLEVNKSKRAFAHLLQRTFEVFLNKYEEIIGIRCPF